MRYVNNWITRLTGGLDLDGEVLPVAQSMLDRLDLSGGEQYTLTLVGTLDPLQQSTVEIVTISASGGGHVLTRAREGTAAHDWPVDTYVYASVTAGILSLFGAVGPAGKSAYQVWLDLGNSGAEQDFIDSLKGAPGTDGAAGSDGADGANGRGIASMAINASQHLIVTYDDASQQDAGILPGGAPVGSAAPQPLGAASAGASGNASREDHVHAMPTAAAVGAVAITAVGAANGVAGLDSSGKVPAAQLPSYVDDVIEVANAAGLPGTGESGKIYVTLDNNRTWRWSGSAYVEISASPGSTDAVPEGATNLYFTAARVLATVLSGLSLATGGAIVSTDSVLAAFGKIQKQLNDHFGAGGSAHSAATTSAAGFMSSTDKAKLDGLSIAQVIVDDATTARTLTTADAGKLIRCSNVAATAVTVSPQSAQSWVAGTQVHLRRAAAANLTISPASGVTLNAPSGGTLVMTNNMTVTLMRTNTADVWDVIGQTVAA